MMRILAFVLLLLFAAPAFAQRVVILEFEADKGNKLRSQVEKALKKANTVDLVPIARWKDLAGKKKLKGAQAMTPAAVAKIARAAEVDSAVEGVLGDKFFVRILDSTGQELWSKELPLKKGLLSDDHAKKLAKAITAAAKTAPVSTKEEDEKVEKPERPEKAEKPQKPERAEPAAKAEKTPDEIDPDQPTRPGELSASERQKRRNEENAEANSATDVREPVVPENPDPDLGEGTQKVAHQMMFKFIRVRLYGTTTWRSYCSRPGVLSCQEYETRVPKPSGDTVDFSPQVPYAGFMLGVELFPLVPTGNNFLAGIMLQGHFALGFSLTKVRVTSPTGETPEKDVVSTDRGWSAEIGYRLPIFFLPDNSKLNKYIGPVGLSFCPRFGVASRVFEIDPKAMVPLPGSFRVFPQVGFDAVVGIRQAHLEVGFTYFINPKPGPDEIVGYGNLDDPSGGGKGTGFSIEAGLAGDLIGPLGYSIKFRYAKFTDQFFGQGKKWIKCDDTQCGGAAEEAYSALFWGLTGAF